MKQQSFLTLKCLVIIGLSASRSVEFPLRNGGVSRWARTCITALSPAAGYFHVRGRNPSGTTCARAVVIQSGSAAAWSRVT